MFDTLRMLHSFGIVPAVEGQVAIPVGLRPAVVVAAINTPGAPFRIDLESGAVPLPEPED